MNNAPLLLTQPPTMHTQMLIRKPAAMVFSAFTDPAITSKFWFSKGSGVLQQGAKVTWEWKMYGVSAQVHVKAIEQDRRIVMEWGDEKRGFTQVEWQFKPTSQAATFVTIVEQGYRGSGDEMVAKVIDSMGGFSFVLAAAKAWLEHGIDLKLVEDHAPAL